MTAIVATSGPHTTITNRESLEEWKASMKTSQVEGKKLKSTVARIVMAVIFAAMIGGTVTVPAFGDNRHNGYYGHSYGHERHGRQHYRHYPATVYAPPPVIYGPAPYQSPGISLVFPIVIR